MSPIGCRPIPGGPADVRELLARARADHPDREALVSRRRRLTYAELAADVAAGAAALHRMGVRPGDRIGASGPNQAEIMIAFLACQVLGAVWVGLNRRLAPPELAFQLQDAGVECLFGDVGTAEKLASIPDAARAVRRFIDIEPGDNAWLGLICEHRGEEPPSAPVDPFAPAAIAYTSGTTGRPKGATHCQHTLMVMAVHAARRSSRTGADLRRGATLPLTILNIVTAYGLAALAGGGAFIIMDRADAAGVAEWIAAERVESLSCAPPTVSDFVGRDDITPAQLQSMAQLICGGGPCPEPLRRGYEAKFGKPLYVTWGLTEAPTAVSGAYASDGPPGASGRVYDHLEVVVRRPDASAAGPGEAGELCVRAASSGPWRGVYAPMLGYWRRPEESLAAVSAGELHTGDIGYVDRDGWLFVVDRAKSVIVRGGQNIYPAEIERVLKTCPGVADAVVVAAPHERYGECALAAVETLLEGAARQALQDELIGRCARELAKYKTPDRWLFARELPRNAMLKVDRGALLRLSQDNPHEVENDR